MSPDQSSRRGRPARRSRSACALPGAAKSNTVVGTGGIGVSFSGPDIPGNVTENTLSGNKNNYISVSGTVAHSSTWNNGGTRVALGGLTIPAGVNLEINPGVHLLNPTMTVAGTLNAEGTAEDPIRFTGIKEEASGEWKSIFFKPGSGASVLNHVEIANGGDRDSGYLNCNNGAVTIEASSPTIVNSTIRDACGTGIRVPEGGAPEIANNDFFKAGSNNGAITYNASSGKTGEINIHDNFIEAGAAGIQIVVYTGATINAKTLSGNTVISTQGTGLSYSGPDIPGNITENILLGNKTNSIVVSGTVAHSSTWNDGGTRVVLGGGVLIPTGITLKITKGVHLVSPHLIVEGTLEAVGTAEDPVRFTGPKEETSANGNPSSSNPAAAPPSSTTSRSLTEDGATPATQTATTARSP